IYINNASNSYTGYTVFNTGTATNAAAASTSSTAKGWVVWGADNALPATTALIVGNPVANTTFGTGVLDLAGRNQTVMSLATGQGNKGVSQGITSSAGLS